MSSIRPSKTTHPSTLAISNKRPSKDIKNAKVKYNAIKSNSKINNNSKIKLVEKKSIEQLSIINTSSNHTSSNDTNSVSTIDTNVSEEEDDDEQTPNANKPSSFYQAIQNNYDYIHDESPTTCLLMPSPVSMTTKFNTQHTVSFSDFARTSSKDNRNNQNPTYNNPNNNNNPTNNLTYNNPIITNNNPITSNNNNNENPLFISSYEDILLAKKYQQQQQQHSNNNTLPSWPHFITAVLASILVISLLSITLSSFCLYKMVILSEYNLDDMNKTVATIHTLAYQLGEVNAVMESKLFESVGNISSLTKDGRAEDKVMEGGCRWAREEGVMATKWVPQEALLQGWSVTGVYCSFEGRLSAKMETNVQRSQHRCVCQMEEEDEEDDEDRGADSREKYCSVDYWICRK